MKLIERSIFFVSFNSDIVCKLSGDCQHQCGVEWHLQTRLNFGFFLSEVQKSDKKLVPGVCWGFSHCETSSSVAKLITGDGSWGNNTHVCCDDMPVDTWSWRLAESDKKTNRSAEHFVCGMPVVLCLFLHAKANSCSLRRTSELNNRNVLNRIVEDTVYSKQANVDTGSCDSWLVFRVSGFLRPDAVDQREEASVDVGKREQEKRQCSPGWQKGKEKKEVHYSVENFSSCSLQQNTMFLLEQKFQFAFWLSIESSQREAVWSFSAAW